MLHLDHNENLKEQVVLIDAFIHKQTKLSREEFLEKVNNVKYIRTTYNSSYISFYITSIDEFNNLTKFHKIVNQGIFDFKGYYNFAIAIQPKLYNWFKTTDITTIQKQIACWLAGSYLFHPEKREIQKKQIYKPLFEEITNIIETYYNDFKVPDLEQQTINLLENKDETLFSSIDKCKEKYRKVCKEYYKGNPPEFLESPLDYINLKEWGTNEHHNFEFIEAYFSEKDWKNIIEKGIDEDLHRVESKDDLWLKWKHTFSTFDERENFVYSFFFEPLVKNKKNLRKKRETISQNVKDKVWKRDNGVCVQCESKEKLEFDHIIPFSKGGSSTYRNIQLLCEPCNRKKSAKI